jgi:hypothetical protein
VITARWFLSWSSPRLQQHDAVERKIHLSQLFKFARPPHFQAGWTLCGDQAKFRQMAPNRIDQLRALSSKTLVCPKCYGPPLFLGALHRDKRQGRSAGRLCNCFRVGPIIFLTLYEVLDVLCWDQTNVMPAGLCPPPNDGRWHKLP